MYVVTQGFLGQTLLTQGYLPSGVRPGLLSVAGVIPTSGPATGGTAVTVYGAGFTLGCTVAFGGNLATSVIVLDGNRITCRTPPADELQTDTQVNVTVTNPGGVVGVARNAYTYAGANPGGPVANEITVNANLQILNGNLQYQSRPTSFRADMTGERGPTPGSLHVPVGGLDVDLSELELLGGVCWIINIDRTNFVTWGIYDGMFNRFYPLGDVLPGEAYVFRLSRFIGVEYGTGTGTRTGTGDRLHFRADTAACDIIVHAFDR